jgi:phosphopantothenoylcysteine synthetase/decarboxylase
MEPLQVLEQYGIPLCVAIAFGYFIWKQNQFIQKELMEELEQDFKRIEMIIIKLIDQQKLMQIEQKGIMKSFESLVKITTKLIKERNVSS